MASPGMGTEAVRLGEARPAQLAGDGDAALAIRARAGDGEAFEQLYLRHRDQVYTLCLNLCADREQAQDLLQETFVRAYRGLRTFRGGAQFATWLYRVAVNVSRDAARKQRVRERPLPVAAPEAGGGDMVHQVRDALSRLRADHRTVLALRYTRSLSYQEIADLLGWSLPKVKVTIHRAKQAFKAAYLGVGEEAG